MKIVVFGASEIGLLVANEFFENIPKINKRLRVNLSKKENLTSKELFLYDVLSNKASTIICEGLTNGKKQNAYGMKIQYINKILLTYSCCNFFVINSFYKNKVKIRILIPEKFKYGHITNMIDKNREVTIDYDSMTINEIYEFIISLIKNLIREFKDFSNANKNNNEINYKLLSNFSYHISTEKVYIVLFIMGGLLFTFLGCFFTYQCIIGNTDFTTQYVFFAWVFSLFMLMLGIVLITIAINSIKLIYNYSKDKKEQNIIVVEGKCIKVRIFHDGLGRYNTNRILKRITFFIESNNKIEKIRLKLDKVYKPLSIDWNNLKKYMVNKQMKFKYLKNSKFVILCDNKVSAYLKQI